MILNGSDQIGKTLKTQVCIVGSGQAGITLAWNLLAKGISVTILEGSRVFNPGGPNEPIPKTSQGESLSYKYNENASLYNGASLGEFAKFEKDFLILPNQTSHSIAKERDRIYGGTSTHWGGQSRPLNASTFEARPGFPGWPISREDLDPYYEQASKLLGLYGDYYGPDGKAGYNFTAEFWAKEMCGNQDFNLEMKDFNLEMYQGVPTENLQFQARKINGKTIGEHDNDLVRVILNASLLQIDSQSDSVSKLTVGVLGGGQNAPTYDPSHQFTITADTYVLACGAVANARQLLLSDIGNENDQVGRYLAAQPLAKNVNAVSTNKGYLDPCSKKLLNFNNTVSGDYGISFLVGELSPTSEAMKANNLGSCWFKEDGTQNFYHELLPEKESRITLTREHKFLDLFKQQQTKATWVLSPGEEDNYKGLANLFKEDVQAINQQSVNITDWDKVKQNMVFNGHHLCTTRMSDNPEDGVVDKNLKVHSMDNLYCAGSSVWTTAGVANPTFSIVAFSIRLADHLQGVLKERRTNS